MTGTENIRWVKANGRIEERPKKRCPSCRQHNYFKIKKPKHPFWKFWKVQDYNVQPRECGNCGFIGELDG